MFAVFNFLVIVFNFCNSAYTKIAKIRKYWSLHKDGTHFYCDAYILKCEQYRED